MSAVSHRVWGARRTAIRWMGVTAFALLGSCGGERRESPDGGTEGAAVTDSAPTTSADTAAVATADTAAPTATDTSTPSATKDTAARQQAQRPAAPAASDSTSPTPAAAATTQPDTAAGQTQAANAPLRDQYHQAPKDTVDQATYDGWKQFNLNCARCHGEDVLGSTIAPHLVMSLKPDGPINTPELFTQVVCAGRPEKGMPSWCALGLDPAKINQIYSYVKGRSEGKIRPGRPAVKPEG